MTLTRYLPGWPPALGIAVLAMLAMPQAALGSEFKPGFGYTSLSKGLFDRCSIVLPFSVVGRSHLGDLGQYHLNSVSSRLAKYPSPIQNSEHSEKELVRREL